MLSEGFPCGSAGKESACNAGDLGLIPGLGRSPGEGNGYPLQYSGLENSIDCIVHGVKESGMTEQLSLTSLPFKSEFFNKEFIIWATISYQSCFCWLYRAYPSLTAKNIINLISLLTIWWCPCVQSSLVLNHQKSKRVPEKHLFLFIDYTKGFDYVDHNKLWKILQEMGIPVYLTYLLRNMQVKK